MTTQTAEIMDVVDSLPIDMKLELIDHLLESISPSRKEIDEAWKEEVERRIDEVENGEVKLIPGEEVFARMRERYKK
ncbi:MAG TPA: addiction module protein [Pyrinomonadaceae bacterium]|nr:addiction module protein [Pyrinomonadaceae bacterium]